MASDPAPNPFRNSAWPQMPQAPFRVGPLPKGDPIPPPVPNPPPEPAPPATVTPVFVRPVDMGQVAPRAPQPPSQTPGQAPQLIVRPAPAQRPTPAPEPPAPEPLALEPGEVQLPPIVVEAARKPDPVTPTLAAAEAPMAAGPIVRPKRAAKRGLPAAGLAAGFVGVVGLAGLGYVFTRGQEAASVAATPAVVAPAETPTAAPPPAVAETPTPTLAEPAAPAPARVAATAPVRAAPRAAAPPRITLPPAAAASAAEEAINAPVLALPPAAPEPEPTPAYTPRAAPDPNAPITTKRPY